MRKKYRADRERGRTEAEQADSSQSTDHYYSLACLIKGNSILPSGTGAQGLSDHLTVLKYIFFGLCKFEMSPEYYLKTMILVL